MKTIFVRLTFLWVLLSIIIPLFAQLPPKLIIQLKKSDKVSHGPVLSKMSAQLSNMKGVQMRQKSELQLEAHFSASSNQADIQAAIESLSQRDDVEFVEEDIVMQAFLEPGDKSGQRDPYYDDQWPLNDPVSGISMPSAWEMTLGDPSQTIAIIDTGITSHPDLDGKVLPGADLISDIGVANDGDGRDMNAQDPGDWVNSQDPCFQGRQVDSTWHGTHVAGTAAAKTENGLGVAGVAWKSKILPIRVLGKCGGYSSDIADAILWAAGARVEGVAQNPNPAKVINLSLGGRGVCGQYMQRAIDTAIGLGSLVVVASGNEGLNLDWNQVSPTNCEGVVAVGATSIDAEKTTYSNYGARIDIMAPGGDFQNPVLSTYNAGKTSPANSTYKGLAGTSMAAPHVSAAASLVFALRPDLYPLQVKELIKQSARSLACPQSQCGQGLLDVDELLRLARMTQPDPSQKGIRPIERSDEEDQGQFFSTNDNAGGCGSIDLSGPSDPGPSGPLMISMLALFLISTQRFKRFL